MGQVLWEDTRQQADKHRVKNAWWEAHGVEVQRRKLDFGDYMRDGSNISIDTKKGLEEVAMDVGRDHRRFVAEMDRAREAGCRLIVLVETAGPYHEIDDAMKWTNKACRMCELRRFGTCDPVGCMRCRKFRRKPLQGGTVAKMMRTLEEDHDVRFVFCHPRSTARTICEILGIDCT